MEDRNDHIREFLKYYVGFRQSPRYAVMIDGKWGIGKTHLIREILDARAKGREDRDYHYVSLYGVSSIEELDAALIASLHPVFAKKGIKIAGRLAKTALKAFEVDPELKAVEIFDKFKGALYVFDDIERCHLSIDSVLGYINEFVEHEGCKVILIANQSEIQDKESYRRRREKLVGMTLEVQPSLREALTSFIGRIDDPFAKNALNANFESVCEAFTQSDLGNLRVLQQAMWDFERFSMAMTVKHRSDPKAVLAMMRLVLALSFEFRSGRIDVQDIGARTSSLIAYLSEKNGDEQGPMQVAARRYPSIELDDSLIPDEVLIDLLSRGIVRVDKIQLALEQSRFFVSVEEEPAWRTVWHWLERRDDDFESAVSLLEQQFKERLFEVPGEILHVFGLRLWLSDKGILGTSREQVVVECKEYVDDLYLSGKLLPSDARLFHEARLDGFGGLGIHHSETFEYRELYEYLKSKRSIMARDNYPKAAEELVALMNSDVDAYFQSLCVTNAGENIYFGVPVLASIQPKRFVDAVLACDPSAQRRVMSVFKYRYAHGALERELKEEKAWLREIKAIFEQRIGEMSKVGSVRISSLLEWFVSPALVEEHDASIGDEEIDEGDGSE